MTKFRLILVTENQNSLEKGKKVAELIRGILSCESGYEISKYEKVKNSYQIEITGQLENQNNLVEKSIELTDRICSPWNVTYERPKNTAELIFNKSDISNFRRAEFNVVKWANLGIENE